MGVRVQSRNFRQRLARYVENTSNIHQFADVEGVLLEKFGQILYQAQDQVEISECESIMLERMWSIKLRSCTCILEM